MIEKLKSVKEKLQKELGELKHKNSMHQAIVDYLFGLVLADIELLEKILDEKNTLVNALTYLNKKARKYMEEHKDFYSANGGFGGDIDDDICFGFVVEYYKNPELEPEPAPREINKKKESTKKKTTKKSSTKKSSEKLSEENAATINNDFIDSEKTEDLKVQNTDNLTQLSLSEVAPINTEKKKNSEKHIEKVSTLPSQAPPSDSTDELSLDLADLNLEENILNFKKIIDSNKSKNQGDLFVVNENKVEIKKS